MALVVVVALLILALFGSAVASRLVGHDGNTTFIYAAGGNKPVGPYLLYAVLDPRVGLERGEQRTKSLVGGVF